MMAAAGRGIGGNDANTMFLCHWDGADEAVTATDVSIGGGDSPHSITFNGGAELDTSEKKFGTASLLLNGTNAYCTCADSDDWTFSGDLTAETWARFAATGSNQGIIAHQTDGNNFWEWRWNNTGGTLDFKVATGGSEVVSLTASWSPSADTWYHLAVIRGWGGNANDWAMVVDGTQIGSTLTDSSAIGNYTGELRIGRRAGAGTDYFNGRIDATRLSDVARWTANYTPPTGPYS